MIADADMVVATISRRGHHGMYGISAVACDRVRLQISAKIGERHQLPKHARLGLPHSSRPSRISGSKNEGQTLCTVWLPLEMSRLQLPQRSDHTG